MTCTFIRQPPFHINHLSQFQRWLSYTGFTVISLNVYKDEELELWMFYLLICAIWLLFCFIRTINAKHAADDMLK